MKLNKLKIEDIISESALIAGFLLFVIGLWLIYKPAAFIAGGIILMAFGFPARRSK